MVGGSLNLRRLKFKAIRDGIPLWRKVFDLLHAFTLGAHLWIRKNINLLSEKEVAGIEQNL